MIFARFLSIFSKKHLRDDILPARVMEKYGYFGGQTPPSDTSHNKVSAKNLKIGKWSFAQKKAAADWGESAAAG